MNNNKIKMMDKTGKQVDLPTGYSVTTLFFNCLPSLIRLDLKSFLIIFGTSFVLTSLVIELYLGALTILLVLILINAIFGLYRNTWLVESYLKKGYKFVSGQNMSKEDLDTSLGYETAPRTWN